MELAAALEELFAGLLRSAAAGGVGPLAAEDFDPPLDTKELA